MKFKNQDDNRYRVRFMVVTEELMDKLTVKEFISYLEENAELEDEEHEYIDGKLVLCKVYDLKEVDSNLHKEFLVTEDGRVFYWLSLLKKVELVDREEVNKEIKRYTVTSQNDVVRCVSGVTFNNQKQAFDYAKELAKTVKQSVWMIEDVFKRSDLGKRFVSKRTALVYPDGRFELI